MVFPHNFCSRACYAKWRKGQRLTVPPLVRLSGSANGYFKHGMAARREKLCERCLKPFLGMESSRFCSRRCKGQWLMDARFNGPDGAEWKKRYSDNSSGQNNTNWRDGRAKKTYGPGWTYRLRVKIKARDGDACVACKSPKRLTVHHRDVSKTNHDPSNLVTLCITCHIRLHRGKWEFLP